MVSLILAVVQAIPALKSLFEDLVAAFIAAQIDHMRSENVSAIRKVLNEKDQRDLEKALGSTTAGAPSGDRGTVIVDAPPPGVSGP